MNEKLHILILEDDPMDAELIQKIIQRAGISFSSVIASDREEFLAAMEANSFDIILADNSLPQFDSEDALNYIKEKELDVPFILVTGTVSEEFAVNMLQQGVDDYILKKNMHRLPTAFKMAIEKRKTKREKKAALEELYLSESKYKILFESSPMPMWMFDRSSLAFIAVNNAAIEHYGYTREEFFSMKSKDIRPEEDIEKHLASAMSDLSGQYKQGVWRHRKKNGEIIFVEIHAHDVMYNEQSVRLVLINDVTEKLKVEEKLKETLTETRRLAESLQVVREEERTGMAREIHDHLGQMLTVLRLEISMIKSKLTPNDAPIKEKIEGAINTTNEVIATVRKIASKLRPALLDDMGLAAALEWQCREFRKNTGVSCVFTEENFEDIAGQLDKSVATAIFRLSQESLTNIMKYAEATQVQSSLVYKDGLISLQISDNGKGFDVEEIKNKKTLGILGMKERVLIMNGDFELKSKPGSGTTITVKVKL
ncbi:MAG: PAS domain S-box protein [Bacteroidota bacterium]